MKTGLVSVAALGVMSLAFCQFALDYGRVAGALILLCIGALVAVWDVLEMRNA